MSTLFPRDWKLVIGQDFTATPTVANPRPAANSALDVSTLDIEFRVLRTLKPQPNKCEITILNLTQAHRAVLEKHNSAAKGKTISGIQVHLEAGYLGNRTTILQCDLRSAVSVREGTEWKTTISGDDGGRAWREARISQTFTKGTPVAECMRQVASTMGVGLGNTASLAGNAQIEGIGATLPGSFTFSGSAKGAMTRLMQNVNLDWSIQNGVLQILPKGQPLSGTAILLTPTSGLLDSPHSAVDASVHLGKSGKSKSARQIQANDPSIIKFDTLLIPGIIPGAKVVVQSELYNGGYLLTECDYKGASYSKEWQASCIGRVY